MTKNANFVSHKKSKQIVDGKPKLPEASALVEGEIAINFGKDVETLSIKNESGDVVTFSSDNYYTEQKLGSGFTGENSGRTVTEALENIEVTVDQVLDDTTSASTNPISSKAVYKSVTDNELVWTNAFVALSGTVSAHTEDTEIHHTHSNKEALDSITGTVGTMAYENASSYSSATEVQAALSKKANTSDLDNFFDGAKYEDSGTTKVINFYHGNTIKATIDASEFIVDGMVDKVQIVNGNLVIIFNTDSGKEPISIPLTDIFDPSNYLTKEQLTGATGYATITKANSANTASTVALAGVTNADDLKAIEALTGTSGLLKKTAANTWSLDTTAYSSATEVQAALSKKANTATTLAGYGIADAYTKSQTSGATELSTEFAKYYTTAQTSGATELATAFSTKANTATTLGGYGITDAYTKSETSGATEISNALGGKVDASEYATFSAATNTSINDLSGQSETVAAALNDLNENKLDITAYTPSGFIQVTNPTAVTKVGLVNSLSQYYDTNIGKCAVIEGHGDTSTSIIASGEYSHAEGNGTIASGNSSHAEGSFTTANGYSSHAEGESTGAYGDSSHAEGSETKASGICSHAEGVMAIASGNSSHAEGDSTEANGDSSHAEGSFTTASGSYSHAEGNGTIASGSYSHAEGYSTKAKNQSEHASGQYNVSVTASTTFGNSGNTLFSVGNGTSDFARHNAFEIRQNGDIYIVSGNTNIKLQNHLTAVKGDAESSYRTGNVNITPANIGLGNVGNFKAVSTEANQGLTDTEKANARANIGAGTSSFSGSYNDLTNKPTIPDISGKLDKVTYEWNKAVNFGSTGYLLIGKFPMYDSNITIDIDSTTSQTYHGTLLIATQNINTEKGGSVLCNVYGDAANTITGSLRVQYSSGSNKINVYFVPESWSKNLIHIRASALASGLDESEICTEVSSVPTTDLIGINNVLINSYPTSLPANGGNSDTVDGYHAASFLFDAGSNPDSPSGSITQPGGSNPISMRTPVSSGSDVGILRITDDNAYICNSSDEGYTFAVWDTDKTKDFRGANIDNASFVVLSDYSGAKVCGNEVIHSGNIGSQSVNYATSASNANTVNGHTVNIDVPADAVFTDTDTWRPLGTGSTDACAGNDSRLSDSRPASDVYPWAKASTKPTYSFSEISGTSNVVEKDSDGDIDVNGVYGLNYIQIGGLPITRSASGVLSDDGCTIWNDWLQATLVEAISSNTQADLSELASVFGASLTYIYRNSGSSDVTVTVPTTYNNKTICTPDGSQLNITIPSGGYGEINFIYGNSVIYARGI